MAEPKEAPEPAVLPEMPTSITATHVIAFVLTLAAIRVSRGLLAPLLLAVLAAVALAPPVRQLSRLMPRWLASALVVFAITGTFAAGVWTISDEVATFSRRLPAIVREVRDAIQSASPRQSLMRQLQQAVTELEKSTAPAKPAEAMPVTIVENTDVQQQIMTWARSAGGYVLEGILLLFLVYFLLASGDKFKQKFVRLSGARLSQRKVTVQMIDEIISKIGGYVFYVFWSGLLVGIVTWLAFMALGVRYAALWGVAAGVLNCIPYFGPTAIMVASAVAAVIQFRDPTTVLAVAGVSVLITSLEGYLLAPIALGRAARANAVAVFVAVMLGGWMWGAFGMILAVPVLMIVKTITEHVESLSAVNELLSES